MSEKQLLEGRLTEFVYVPIGPIVSSEISMVVIENESRKKILDVKSEDIQKYQSQAKSLLKQRVVVEYIDKTLEVMYPKPIATTQPLANEGSKKESKENVTSTKTYSAKTSKRNDVLKPKRRIPRRKTEPKRKATKTVSKIYKDPIIGDINGTSIIFPHPVQKLLRNEKTNTGKFSPYKTVDSLVSAFGNSQPVQVRPNTYVYKHTESDFEIRLVVRRDGSGSYHAYDYTIR